MKNKIIKNIPNMITISRISASFLACIMFILGNYEKMDSLICFLERCNSKSFLVITPS